ncbi:hypothetical protein HK104_007542, partial [Borealophlyctis nickersoniae]
MHRLPPDKLSLLLPPPDTPSFQFGLDVSVAASQPVECLRVAKLDLVRVLPAEVLSGMMDPASEGVLSAGVEELQRCYLTRKAWEGYRRKVVAEVADRK